MKNWKAVCFALPLTVMLGLAAGCSTMGTAADIDPATGKIDNRTLYGKVEATTLTSEAVVLQKYKPLVLTLGAKFFKEQTIKLGYFDNVVSREDMEQLLIREGKADVVTDVTNLLSWKRIADQYKPFLVLKPDFRDEGRASYAQLKVFQADTATEVFSAEVKLDVLWKGVNDDTVWYPLFNAFIDWVEKNK